MKVAIVTPVFPPYGGGIGVIAYHHARILAAAGYEVEVFTPTSVTRHRSPPPIERWRLRFCPPAARIGNAAWLPRLDRALPTDGAVHLHYPFIGAVNAIVRWRKSHPAARLILHYHMDLVAPGFRGIAFRRFQLRALPKLLAVADRIAVLTRDYAGSSLLSRWLAELPQRFVELPNGVDAGRFQPGAKPGDLVQRYSLAQAKTVLFVGGLDPAHYFKGVEFLLAALAQRPAEVHLVIVGGGSLGARYQRRVQQLGLAARVKFAGAVPFEELPRYYRLADVFVLPSWTRSEAFGLVLLEAMATGVSTIASNLPGVRTVVRDGVTGLLAQPADPRDLAAKLAWLLNHPDLANMFGQAGRRRVVEQFAWPIIGAQLTRLYQELGIKPSALPHQP